MSDTDIFRVNKQIERLDLIDEEWIYDTLSDDDIDELQNDDIENHFAEEENENEEGIHDEDAWADLGLDRFVNENQVASSLGGNQSQPQS